MWAKCRSSFGSDSAPTAARCRALRWGPGESGTLRFQAGSAALLLNPSGQPAHLHLRVTGDTQQLRMGYEPNGQQ